VADLDLEKFFGRVNHDHLLAAVAERVADKRMLKLIRAFLEAGVMEDGLVSQEHAKWASAQQAQPKIKEA
jgi:RNA-directed DNA polymerase